MMRVRGMRLALALAPLVWQLAGHAYAAQVAQAHAEPASRPAPAICVLDLTYLGRKDLRDPKQAREVWDTLHLAASVQGIVNRSGPRLFLRFMPQPDDFWLAQLRREGRWLAGRPVRRLKDVEDMLAAFAADLKGLVVYKEDLAATSNLASTVAGIESRACLRYDDGKNSLSRRVTALDHAFAKDVLRLYRPDGKPLFAGKTGTAIPGTGSPGIPSTGSAKCDAYLWAKCRYLDTGRASKEYLAYYIDAYWLKDPALSGANNCTLTNHDFFISHGAMFFDLHVWPEEAPVDDPAQRPGTDLRTLQAILRSMHTRAGGKVFQIGGFVPWAWKYTSHGRAGSKHQPVDTEWGYARVISAYNGVMDADALGYAGLANASFYQHFPLRERYPQNTPPTDAELRKRGLANADGSPRSLTYVLFYMGDYDSAAWLNVHLPRWYQDPARGTIDCVWAFNPNLDRRVPHAMHFARTRATRRDWFISGDCGAGYLNPGMLTAPRLDRTIPDGWQAWIEHNAGYYRKYDLSVTGFVIDGHAPPMGRRGLDAYRRFSPTGLIGQKLPAPGVQAGVMPYLRMAADLSHAPEQAGRQLAGLTGVPRVRFVPVRTILKSPTWHARTIAAARKAPGGDRLRFVDPYTFFRLAKRHLTRPGGPGGRRVVPARGKTITYTAGRPGGHLAPIRVADGPFEQAEVAGRTCLRQVSKGIQYIYFDTDPAFAHDIPPDSGVVLEARVTVFDRRAGRLLLHYDSHDPRAPVDGAYGAATARLAGTGKWVTVAFTLRGPRFAGRQNGGANLRVVNTMGDLAVHGVSLSRPR